MLESLAVVFALAGLAAVVTEILRNDPGLISEITSDVRAMALPSRFRAVRGDRCREPRRPSSC
ncbi:hypothetical protein [Azospirillum himalayense]|uniref:Uncharacterized protein n=1 Tax=Azospirillum himalayense TaxID=654847 RepID=A0ABW0GF83_9PROT